MWTNDRQWVIAPESVVLELSRFRKIYVSELINTPPERVCYRIKHKFPKLTSEKAVTLFDEMLELYLKSREINIPIGTVWGGEQTASYL